MEFHSHSSAHCFHGIRVGCSHTFTSQLSNHRHSGTRRRTSPMPDSDGRLLHRALIRITRRDVSDHWLVRSGNCQLTVARRNSAAVLRREIWTPLRTTGQPAMELYPIGIDPGDWNDLSGSLNHRLFRLCVTHRQFELQAETDGLLSRDSTAYLETPSGRKIYSAGRSWLSRNERVAASTVRRISGLSLPRLRHSFRSFNARAWFPSAA